MRHLILSSILIFIVIRATADTHTWVSTTTSNWNTAANWSPAQVPAIGDDIIIDGDNSSVPLIITTTVRIDDITIRDGGVLTINTGGSLTTDGGGAGGSNGLLNMSNGGVLNVLGGFIRVTDDLTANGSTINISGGELETDDIFQMLTGSDFIMTGGTFDNNANGSEYVYFDNSDATISGGSFSSTNDLYIENGANLDISGSADVDVDDLRVLDNSTLDVTGGTLDVDRMELRDNSVSNLTGGTITLDGWLWTDENAQLTIATTFTGTPNDGNDDDDFWIWGGSSVTVEDGAVISGWTNLDFVDTGGGGGNANPASLTINGGSFDITGDINAAGSDEDTITINDGTLNVDGTFNIGNSDIVIFSNGGVISVFDIVDTSGNDTSNFNTPIEGSVISGGIELPIELISFEARYINNQVEISWVTGSEINNDYIEVQKSYDGIDFHTISRHQGFGTTSDIQNYKFTDTKGLNVPVIYYRLQQFDYDGKSETFPTKAVHTQYHSQQMQVNIFPNPAVSHVKINLSGMLKNEITQVSIIDINGRMLKSESFNAINHTYELSGLDQLNSGVYFLFLKNGDLMIKERLVIK